MHSYLLGDLAPSGVSGAARSKSPGPEYARPSTELPVQLQSLIYEFNGCTRTCQPVTASSAVSGAARSKSPGRPQYARPFTELTFHLRCSSVRVTWLRTYLSADQSALKSIKRTNWSNCRRRNRNNSLIIIATRPLQVDEGLCTKDSPLSSEVVYCIPV